MKILITWHWEPDKAKEVTERYSKWEPSGKYKMLYPISSIIGANKGFGVAEVDDILELHKDLSQWTDLITYKCSPCVDSRKIVPLSK